VESCAQAAAKTLASGSCGCSAEEPQLSRQSCTSVLIETKLMTLYPDGALWNCVTIQKGSDWGCEVFLYASRDFRDLFMLAVSYSRPFNDQFATCD
jgi:hypothetical protein